jgi:hypothetical protein
VGAVFGFFYHGLQLFVCEMLVSFASLSGCQMDSEDVALSRLRKREQVLPDNDMIGFANFQPNEN